MLLVLSTLGALGMPTSAADLAAAARLPISTLYRQLALLRRWGFVCETPAGYAPGPACLQLAWGFDESAFLRQVAAPAMQALAADTGEAVGLMALIDDTVSCIAMIDSSQPLRCAFAPGTRLPLTAGASAKALLAALPGPERDALLARLAEAGHRLSAPAAMARNCARIRAAGHVITDGEVDAGVWGVSVPILPNPTRLAAALTVMAPSVRAAASGGRLTERACAAATRIAADLASAPRGAGRVRSEGETS